MAVKGMYLMEMGEWYDHAGRSAYGLDWDERIVGPVFAALITTDDGNILVDTGFPPNDERVFQTNTGKIKEVYRGDELKVLSVHDIRERLKEHNLSVDDIRYVIASHLHMDHYGGIQFFKNSTVLIHRDEYSQALYGEKFARPYFRECWDLTSLKHEFLDGDKVIVPGVMVMHTPGHTLGHLSIVVDCPKDGTIILAGDHFHLEYNWLNRVPIGDYIFLPYPVLWYQSWERIKACADRSNARVIPSHDAEYWKNNPKEFH